MTFRVDAAGTAHEDCKLVIMLGQSILGTIPWDAGETPHLRWHRGGWAFFCSECGEVWGRLVCVGPDEKVRYTTPVVVSCDQHYDQWNVAGSMMNQLCGALNELPEELIRREFILHLREAETS